MSNGSEQFPHIELRLVREGTAVATRGQRKPSPRTSANRGDAGGHGRRLKGSVDSIISSWQKTLEQRKEEGKPDLPQAVPFILQVDPNSFDADQLKSFGIEVIAELEDGYIIGASADLEFTELQKKIENCINGERGGGKVPEIWEILEGIKRPEYILSEKLLANWAQIKDNQPYTVDVGIACVGLQAKFSDYPERKADEDSDRYMQRVARWLDKRDQTEQEWDDLQFDREQDFFRFVKEYSGTVIRSAYDAPSLVRLPDSFSCRIQISGKGLKDLVLTFPYVFDVSEPDEFHELLHQQSTVDDGEQAFELEAPAPDAPRVCVIDSGIQEQHPLLRAAIDDANSRSWVPGDTGRTADQVTNGGHGTRVAGAVLYPQAIPRLGRQKAGCWIQNARILDQNCQIPEQLFPPETLEEIVNFYKPTGTRIFNHSITGSTPCRTQYMSAWATAIDKLTWDHDVLFIVSAGNLPLHGSVGISRLSISDHFATGRTYPDYLLEASSRVANPAQSFQALTVGSVAASSYHNPPLTSIASGADHPSAFTCCGLGIWESIKPEVVEYGGDLIMDESNPAILNYPPDVCPELVRSTLGGGPVIASDKIGTSFAAPKVAHIAAAVEAEFPQENCLLYRALVVQSARLPQWTAQPEVDLSNVIRQMGYGIPNLDRAIGNTANRITLTTRGEQRISARKACVYQVQLPPELRSPGESYTILVEVTLSYKAEPRRTRRQRRKYLSTWLDWECSKRGEDPDQFLARVLKESEADEETERGEGLFEWTLGKQKNWGKVKGLSRGAGTIQKDWAIVKSYDLREAFCLAVIGHEGWNNDPTAEVPYSLVVSFEALETNIPVYTSFVQAQIQIQQRIVTVQ
jgi:hypothetical protein